MSGNTSKNNEVAGSAAPDWYAAGLRHIWLPYTQMKPANPPLAVTATSGSLSHAGTVALTVQSAITNAVPDVTTYHYDATLEFPYTIGCLKAASTVPEGSI